MIDRPLVSFCSPAILRASANCSGIVKSSPRRRRCRSWPVHDAARGPVPRHPNAPLGRFTLRVPSCGSPRFQIADGARQRVKGCLDNFVVGIVKLAEQSAAASTARGGRRRHLGERRRPEGAKRRRAEEAGRLKALESQVLAWPTASDIRAFVEAARLAEPNSRRSGQRISSDASSC